MTGSPSKQARVGRMVEKIGAALGPSRHNAVHRFAAVLVPCAVIAFTMAATEPAIAQNQVGPPVKLFKQPAPKQPDSKQEQPKRIRPGTAPAPAGAVPPKSAEEPASSGAPGQARSGGAIGVQSLGVVDVSSAGLLDDEDGGLGADMWRGIDRTVVESLLPRLPVATASRAMQELTRRLLLTRARVPDGAAAAASLLGLRVERLAAAGDTGSVNALMGLAPADLSDRNVSRAKVDGLLLSGDTAGACADFQTLVVEDPEETYWVKGLAFCRALVGAHEQASFAAVLLRDLGVQDPPFFTLLGVLSGDRGLALESLLDPTPLHIAMTKTAQLPLPVDAIAGASPGILAAIARSPNADLDLRLAAAERAEAVGALDATLLAEIYRSVTFAPDELSDAVSALQQLSAPRANALLYQVAEIQEVPTARAEALTLAWKIARERGGYGTAVRVNLSSLQALEPAAELAWFAIDAVRALYTAGDHDNAKRWFAMVQSNATPGNADAAMAVIKLWPLPFLRDARYQQGWDGVAVLGPWIDGMDILGGSPDQQAQQVEIVLTLLAAFDFAIPEEAWSPLLQNPLSVSSFVPAAGLWLHLRNAAERGAVGATTLFSLLALGKNGPAGADPIVLSEVVTALRNVGLDDAARQVAVEAAMARMP